MNTKPAFSTLLTVLITAVVVGVLVGVVTYTSIASKKDLEIEDLKEELSQAKEEAQVEPGSKALDMGTIKEDKNTPLITPDEIKNWKIYNNDKYGFKFMYPGEWKIAETSENDAKESETEWIFATHIKDKSGSVQISVYDNNWLNSDTVNLDTIQTRLTKVNGIKLNELSEKEINGFRAITVGAAYYFPANKNVILFSESSGKSTQDEFWPVYNQILSTFILRSL